MGLLRDLLHNEEQIVWAEQTEIEFTNFLKEFDTTVWPVFEKHGYTKGDALNHWTQAKILGALNAITEELRGETS